MPAKKPNKTPYIVMILVILLAAGLTIFFTRPIPVQPPAAIPEPEQVKQPQKKPALIDYNQLESDEQTKNLMADRKAEYGVDQGVDMIAKADETLKVGETIVSMKEILEQIRLKKGGIVENDLQSNGTATVPGEGVYGIYVVQQTDNIWNIHFKFLKDYFIHRGISLSPSSDEPDTKGYSSGVGKVLKFSENMVHIYNLEEKKLVDDLDIIVPLNKIIVYNMDQVFALLDQIDYEHVNRIQFDGETLWVPAAQ